MKNIIFALIAGLLVGIDCPAFGMLSDQDEYILKSYNHQIHNETSLQCARYSKGKVGVTKTDFEIVNLEEDTIGKISIQCYPESMSYYQITSDSLLGKVSTPPVVHLLHIAINKEYQRQGHGTRAMETLFAFLPKNAEMWLEYSRRPGVKDFYERFGFKETKEPPLFITNEYPTVRINTMKLKLSNAKFPYQAKQRPVLK